LIESLQYDGSILFFINDDDDVEDERFFCACFCGNGTCIYSPFGKVTPIIYDDEEFVTICDDDVSNSFGESFLGNGEDDVVEI